MRSLILITLLLLPSLASAADPPVLIWGFTSECSSLPEVDRAVRKRLEESAYPASVLEGTEPHLGCEPAQCAEILRSSCPVTSGLLLGGTVYRGAVLRTRLWVHDLAKNRTAYQDDYSQTADVESALGAHAGALLDRPNWDAGAPSTLPLYCQSDPARAKPAASAPASRVYFVAYGDRGPRASVSAALRQLVQESGREAQPVPTRQEADAYTLPVLRRITSKSAGAQVLGAEVLSEQKIQLWLFDSGTQQTAGQATPIECPGCDRDAMIQKLRTEAKALLGACFGESCTSKFNVMQAPKEACEPLPALRCGRPANTASGVLPLSSELPGAGQDVVSPRLARLTNGALWSIFAASTAASAGLLIANYSGVGTIESSTAKLNNNLLLPGGIMAGMAALTLAIAIPTTVVLSRAANPAQHSLAKTGTLRKLLQCPQLGADREVR